MALRPDVGVFHVEEAALEIDGAVFPPEAMRDIQKFLGHLVSFIMRRVVTITSEIRGVRARDDVQRQAAFREVVQRVRLLDGVDRTHQAWTEGDQKLDFLRLARQGGCRLPGVQAVRARRRQNVDAPGVFGRSCDPGKIIQRGGTLGHGGVDLMAIARVERAQSPMKLNGQVVLLCVERARRFIPMLRVGRAGNQSTYLSAFCCEYYTIV